MLFAVFLSFALLLLCFLLHYHQHFTLCSNKQSESRPRVASLTESNISQSKSRQTYRKKICEFWIQPIDEFDFFPPSFVYYLLFKIMICLLIAAVYIAQNTTTSYTDLFFRYSLQTERKPLSESNNIFVHISNYILIYSVMFLSLWESLFSFYKFYSTLFVILKCKIISTRAVIRKFMIYAILFCIVFVAQIHFYYYAFPAILALHFLFNTYCTFKFASMLILKYNDFIEHDGLDNAENMKILHSVYFMRRSAMICCMLQVSYLGLFTFFHSVNTLIYLPIIWSICACINTLNFVRNRKFIKFKLFQCQICCTKLCIKNEATNDRSSQSLSVKVAIPIEKIVECDTPTVDQLEVEAKMQVQLQSLSEISETTVPSMADTYTRTVSVTSTFSAMSVGISVSDQSASSGSSAKISVDSQASATLSVPKKDKASAKRYVIHRKSSSDVFYPKAGGRFIASGSNSAQSPMHSLYESQSYDPQNESQNSQFKSSISTINRYSYGSDDSAEGEQEDSGSSKVDIIINDNNASSSRMQLKLETHHSEPIVLEEDMDVIQSLDLFAKYGFCSRATVKSMYKSRSRQNKMKVQLTR